MKKRIIDYKIRVHTLPTDLHPPLSDEYLYETAKVYKMAIDLKIIWPIWMIDEYGKKWILIEFENENGEDEHHTLAIDENTYREVESDSYEVFIEGNLSSEWV